MPKKNQNPNLFSILSLKYLALIFVFTFIAAKILLPVLNLDNVVQDDFRQSNFWMWSFYDQELFANDFFIPNYMPTFLRTPTLIYLFKICGYLNLNLIFASKLFVLILSVFSSLLAFLFFRKYIKSLEGFQKSSSAELLAVFFSIAMTVVFWCTDHLSAMSARSFIWIGLFGYMYLKLLNKNILAAALSFFLLFLSPVTFLLCLVMEGFYWLINLIKTFSKSEKNQNILIRLKNIMNIEFYSILINSITAFIFHKIVLKDMGVLGKGTAFTVEEMKKLPELNPGGRHPIFGSSIWDGSWWNNEHWGLGIGYLKISDVIIWALVLAFIIIVFNAWQIFTEKSKSNSLLKSYLSLLESPPVILLYSSIFLYFASQILFPTLYLPSRYLGVPLLLLSMILLFSYTYFSINHIPDFLETMGIKIFRSVRYRNVFVYLLIGIFTLVFYLHFRNYYHPRFVSINPQLKAVLEKTPKASLIAGHPALPDLSTVSITCKRKVFIDYERSLSYTKEGLAEIRRRTKVSLDMVYAKNEAEFRRLAEDNGISHFLVHAGFYSLQYLSNPRYIEPYNAYLKKLSYNHRPEDFYLYRFLKEKNTGFIIYSLKP
jgi:hypothetical protein